MRNLVTNIFFLLLFVNAGNQLYAQAPVLGTAAKFALFTTVGAITNTGISPITGDVGSNSGAGTGFGNVNGVMHSGNGATLIGAADLATAYNQLNAAIPNFFVAPLFGNGDTLVPGVYSTSAVATLSGNLILDGQGDSNAVFIFKIQAAFSSTAAAKVKLINGAMACNVFWKVEGLVDLATGTYMRGTIVANNAAINFSALDTLEGRALSTTGAIALNGTMVYTPQGCGSPILWGPVMPNLLSAASFALFTSNGAMSNAGISNIVGDVGTNVGLTTGFNPLFVAGTIHPIPDGSTSAAAADLLNASSLMNIMPYDIELLYPAQFGNDLVLTPHTYLLNAATSLTGNIYLNAQGNPNAVFFIKIYGALSTSTFSHVILINGAQASNVFWLVAGAVSIDSYSEFNGSLVSINGAISTFTGVAVNGRLLTTDGAFSTVAITATSFPAAPLAFNWLYFNGSRLQNDVVLNWATTSTSNTISYTIEKSTDGYLFTPVITIPAAIENHNEKNNYQYTDVSSLANNYYRIAQMDNNGIKTNYKTIKIENVANNNLVFNHCINGNNIEVRIDNAKAGKASITLYSVAGNLISTTPITLENNSSAFAIPKPMHAGLYFLIIAKENNIIYTSKVLVN